MGTDWDDYDDQDRAEAMEHIRAAYALAQGTTSRAGPNSEVIAWHLAEVLGLEHGDVSAPPGWLIPAKAQAQGGADDEIRALFAKANMAAGYPEDDEDQSFDAQVGRAFIKARKKLAAILAVLTPAQERVEAQAWLSRALELIDTMNDPDERDAFKALMNGASDALPSGPKPPMTMKADQDWLRRRTETDPDVDVEAWGSTPKPAGVEEGQ